MILGITCSNPQLVSAIARSLKWAPEMEALADKVLKQIQIKGEKFNTLHLRLEKDARDWTEILGGAQVCLEGITIIIIILINVVAIVVIFFSLI